MCINLSFFEASAKMLSESNYMYGPPYHITCMCTGAVGNGYVSKQLCISQILCLSKFSKRCHLNLCTLLFSHLTFLSINRRNIKINNALNLCDNIINFQSLTAGIFTPHGCSAIEKKKNILFKYNYSCVAFPHHN